jgi:IS30 family transposase
VLLELDRAGLLAGCTNQEIADAFGQGLHRSTILRDLRPRMT